MKRNAVVWAALGFFATFIAAGAIHAVL